MSVVPEPLKNALQSLAIQLDFPDNFQMEINQLDAANEMLGSAYEASFNDGERSERVFVKCLEIDSVCESNKVLMDSVIFFKNEVVFYGDLLPAMEDMSEKYPQHRFNAAPRCYKTFNSPNLSFIIMENLQDHTYNTPDPSKPLTFKEAHLVLQELAKLHALSFILRETQPFLYSNIIDAIEETLFREDTRSTFGKIFVHAIHDSLKLAKNSLPPGSIYVDKLSEFTLNVFDKMMGMVWKKEIDDEETNKVEKDEEYRVITHGDVRHNNILLRYDNENDTPSGICLLDYQACRYSSPAHDIAFFLLVCVDKQTRDNHFEDLLHHSYHETLCAALNDYNLDPLRILPLSALREQLKTHARFALALALVGLPLYLDEGVRCFDDIERETDSDEMDKVVLEAAQKCRSRKSMKCKNKMMEILIDTVNRGWL